MPEVARSAGVGIGTVYRHFPTRQALARSVRHAGQVLSEGRGLSASVAATVGSSAPRGEMLAQLRHAVEALIEPDQAAGTLRADVTVADVYLPVGGLSGIIRTGSGDWRRFIDLALTGLRPRADS
jgi:AcrR family transcriptional regulator